MIRKNNVNLKNLLSLIENNVNKSSFKFKTLRGSLFPLFPLRVKCQNHERVPISPILVAHVLTRWQGMHGFGTSPLGAIGEIETLSWFWKKADMCVDMCWHSLEIGWFMLQMWWLPWMKTCMIKNVFGIYGYWVNKCNYPQTYKYN